MVVSAPALSKVLATQAWDCSTLATMLRWVSMAPLATPVVPPVYCRKAMSSWPICTGFSVALRPASSAARNRRALGMLPGRHLPVNASHDEIHDRALERAEHAANGGDNHCLEPGLGQHFLQHVGEVLEDDDDLGAGVIDLVLEFAVRGVEGVGVDHEPPARITPNRAMGNCRTFGIMSAIRVPGSAWALCCSQAGEGAELLARAGRSSWLRSICT